MKNQRWRTEDWKWARTLSYTPLLCLQNIFWSQFSKGTSGRFVYFGLDRWSSVDAKESVWLGGVLTRVSGEDISYNIQWSSLAFIFVICLSTIINTLPHKIILNEHCLCNCRVLPYLCFCCIRVHTAVQFWDSSYLYFLFLCSKAKSHFLAVLRCSYAQCYKCFDSLSLSWTADGSFCIDVEEVPTVCRSASPSVLVSHFHQVIN